MYYYPEIMIGGVWLKLPKRPFSDHTRAYEAAERMLKAYLVNNGIMSASEASAYIAGGCDGAHGCDAVEYEPEPDPWG